MNLIYEGKAKKVFETGEKGVYLLEFKDSLTAFNAQKKGSFPGKGQLNLDIASLIFERLHVLGVKTHYISRPSPLQMKVKAVKIIPLEVVVRNVLAGSTAKKMGRAEGEPLPRPLVEFYYKSDELQDPFLSDDQAVLLGVSSEGELRELKSQALRINEFLKDLFSKCGLDLIDFKIEFGRTAAGDLLLADEITPDCCRLWDQKTKEKYDKDRFRRDLGNVEEGYKEVLRRLKEAR